MPRKNRHLVSDSKNISLRNRGKVFPYKKCSLGFFATDGRTTPFIYSPRRRVKTLKNRASSLYWFPWFHLENFHLGWRKYWYECTRIHRNEGPFMKNAQNEIFRTKETQVHSRTNMHITRYNNLFLLNGSQWQTQGFEVSVLYILMYASKCNMRFIFRNIIFFFNIFVIILTRVRSTSGNNRK